MDSLAVRLLLKLSRPQRESDYAEGVRSWSMTDALRNLEDFIPNYSTIISGKRVLDFGCGSGHQTVALAKSGAAFVTGVDIVPALIADARGLAHTQGVDSMTCFIDASTTPLDDLDGQFDVIVSQDSMEHFLDPAAILTQWRRLLRPDGVVLVTFGPPWLAPYGAHMHFFTKVPWVHLLFSERVVLAARSKFRNDGARHYADVEGGLGKLTIFRFDSLVHAAGFRSETPLLTPVKGMRTLTKIPLLREFFTNNVATILRRADQ